MVKRLRYFQFPFGKVAFTIWKWVAKVHVRVEYGKDFVEEIYNIARLNRKEGIMEINLDEVVRLAHRMPVRVILSGSNESKLLAIVHDQEEEEEGEFDDLSI